MFDLMLLIDSEHYFHLRFYIKLFIMIFQFLKQIQVVTARSWQSQNENSCCLKNQQPTAGRDWLFCYKWN